MTTIQSRGQDAAEELGAEARGAPALEVRQVSKDFPGEGGSIVRALDRVSLAVAPGELVALVGPSGAGKSTLLSIVAGLEAATSGEVVVGGSGRSGGRPRQPRQPGHIGYMPQRDLLLPWRTALGNAIAGLEVQGVPRKEARDRARALFAIFGLSGFEDSYPHVLSGGMRQRVAFARTVLAASDLLLLDEPFGALDALTRAGVQRWLLEIWSGLRKSCLLVTHDLDEALLLADRVYVLSPRPGRIRLERAVPLERPRDLTMLARPEVAGLKAELLAALTSAKEG